MLTVGVGVVGLLAIPVNRVQAVAVARQDCQNRGAASDNFGVAGVAGAAKVSVKRGECGVAAGDAELGKRVGGVGCRGALDVGLGGEELLGLLVSESQRCCEAGDPAIKRCSLLNHHLASLLELTIWQGRRLMTAAAVAGLRDLGLRLRLGSECSRCLCSALRLSRF